MTKNIKSVIVASAAALAFGAVAVGTTFALFTSKAETNVTVQSGTVKVEQSSHIESVAELGGTAVLPTAGVYTNSIGGRTYVDTENSAILHLENWAPGDKVVFEIRNVNKSNVTILSRLNIQPGAGSDENFYYNGLDIDYVAYDKDDHVITSMVDDWESYAPAETEAGYLLSRVVVTVEFVDHDNGEIKYDEQNSDNQYQNTSCSIVFTQEAVQGNAYVGVQEEILP